MPQSAEKIKTKHNWRHPKTASSAIIMPFSLSPLPFQYNDLEPFLSSEILRLHHDQYQRRYIEQLNSAIDGTEYSEMTLAEIVQQSDGLVFNRAALVWNHDFHWHCLSPGETVQPNGDFLSAIEMDFGDLDGLRKKFRHAATNSVGSGWTWLVQAVNGRLHIVNTRNAETPLVDVNSTPLLTVDIWEHAYCLDYQDRLSDYVDNFWLFINWPFVQSNFTPTG